LIVPEGIIAAGGVPNAVGRGWFSLIDGCPVYLFLRDDVLRIDWPSPRTWFRLEGVSSLLRSGLPAWRVRPLFQYL